MRSETSELLLEKKNGVLTIILNRPATLNALNDPMRDGLTRVFTEAAADNDTRVLLLTGMGRGFCSGGDTGGMRSRQSEATTGPPSTPRRPIALAMRELGKPIIAAINGAAVGGGFGLAMNSDIRIASDRAELGPIFVRRALAIEWGLSYLLPRLIGLGKTLELALTGDLVDAKEAERLGLVNRVVPHNDLMEVAQEFALRLAKGPTLSHQFIKKAIYAGLDSSFAAQLNHEANATALAQQTEDHEEAMKAFREKREPFFKGR